MSPLSRADVLPLDDFLATRRQHLAAVLTAQTMRRVAVGPNMTLLFENHTSMLWQIHEMCRVEGLKGDAIDHELRTYNALLPDAHSLSATLLIEYQDPDVRDAALRDLLGLHQHLFLKLKGRRLAANFDPDQIAQDRVSAVQFVRFALDAQAKQALGDLSSPVEIVVDHPAYQAVTVLSRATRGALLDDLDEATL